MLRCEHCRLSVRGNRRVCPLCQGPLTGEPSPEVFPYIPSVYREFHLFFRLLVAGSLAAVVACLGLNAIFPQSGPWSLFVLGGLACAWLILGTAISKRRNIPKNLLYQVLLLSLLSVAWDFLTGWQGWSLDYVLPILSASALVAMLVVLKVLGRYIEDYLIYLLLAALLGIFPLLFWLLGLLGTVYPTLICVAASTMSFFVIVVFHFERLAAELKRRLHL